MDLNDLGITQEELQNRLIDRLAKQMLNTISIDDEGHGYEIDSSFSGKLETLIRERIDETINAIAKKEILPNVSKYIEKLTLQEANKWGEKKGEPVSFVEYLISRAEKYMTEKVDYEGKTKQEKSSYHWQSTQTRIAHMIHRHLHYSIETAMEIAVRDVNKSIAKGLEETVKIKMQEITDKLKVSVKTN